MVEQEDPIYLDHNATTPLLPQVVEAMLPFLSQHFGNPSSGHVYGRRAQAAVEQARAQVASLLGCEPAAIIFTGGGTESSNLAIRGVVEAVGGATSVVTSAIEHPATSAPCRWLSQRGHSVVSLGVDGEGRVCLEQAREAIKPGVSLVTVMHANNETGVLQPLEALVEMAREVGALVHTDAAQSVGKVPVDGLGVDLMTVAGHKLYGPKGVGALMVRKGVSLAPFALGAGHEGGLRPGTENVASIVGLGAAAQAVSADLDAEARRVARLRDALWETLCAGIDGMALNGHPTERLPNTLNARFPGVSGSALLERAPLVAASTGSACHEGHESPSGVLVAMGIAPQEALGSVRLTLGRGTTLLQVQRAASALIDAWRVLRPTV